MIVFISRIDRFEPMCIPFIYYLLYFFYILCILCVHFTLFKFVTSRISKSQHTKTKPTKRSNKILLSKGTTIIYHYQWLTPDIGDPVLLLASSKATASPVMIFHTGTHAHKIHLKDNIHTEWYSEFSLDQRVTLLSF